MKRATVFLRCSQVWKANREEFGFSTQPNENIDLLQHILILSELKQIIYFLIFCALQQSEWVEKKDPVYQCNLCLFFFQPKNITEDAFQSWSMRYLTNFCRDSHKGSSVKDVRKILGIFYTPSSPTCPQLSNTLFMACPQWADPLPSVWTSFVDGPLWDKRIHKHNSQLRWWGK